MTKHEKILQQNAACQRGRRGGRLRSDCGDTEPKAGSFAFKEEEKEQMLCVLPSRTGESSTPSGGPSSDLCLHTASFQLGYI